MTSVDSQKKSPDSPEKATRKPEHFPWTTLSPAALHAVPQVRFMLYSVTTTTQIFIADKTLQKLAHRLATGLQKAASLTTPPKIVMDGTPAEGDIVLTFGTPSTQGVSIPVQGKEELYRIDIRENIEICAENEPAMARAVVSLYKAAQVSSRLEFGVIIDAPRYAERSVLIDVGRKYFSPQWIKNLLKEMAWNQLNTLHLHLTDNEGVRVVFPSRPDIDYVDTWSDEELRDILDTAASYHIEVIPEIEIPGHMGWILRNRPEYQLQLSSGQKVFKALDFSIPEAREFIKSVVNDTLDMFPNSRHFHLGADEYFLQPITPNNTPQLTQYVREQSEMPNANALDAVRFFINELAAVVRDKGRIARVWNDGVVQKNQVIPLDQENEVECWSIWGTTRNEINVEELVNSGYCVKNAHGDFYFIIRPNWDNLNDPKHSPQGLYDIWRANLFMDKAGAAVTEIPSSSRQLVGAGIQVWADDPDFWSQEEVWRQLVQWILPLGQRTWDSPNAAPDYSSLSPVALSRRHPPVEF